MSKSSIRILLVDDSPVVLDAVRRWIEHAEGIEVVGVALSVKTAIEQVARLQPEVVLMDVRMPEKTGLDAVQELKQQAPNIRIILMSHYPFDQGSLAAVGGVDAVLSKTELVSRLVPTVQGLFPDHGAAKGT